MRNLKVVKMVQVAMITAVICVLSPLTLNLPVSPVPVSICILAIYIGAYALGCGYGTLSCLLYIMIGLIGVPVFANFTAGPEKLFGPTGGYIIGYLFVAFFTGLFIDKFEKKIYMHVAGMLIGVLICYALGTAWLAIQGHMTFYSALWAGVIPFIPADIAKIVIMVLVGPAIRKAAKKVSAWNG